MSSFLDGTFYGNTILDWTISFSVILIAIIVGKLVYWICKNVLSKLTAKTTTSLDDILLDLIEEPVVFAIMVGGIWYGFSLLRFSEAVATRIDHGVQFLLVLAITWFLSRLLDALFRQYLLPLAETSETDIDDQLLPIVRRGTNVIVWSLGIIVGLNNAGYEVGALLAGLGIGGLALAMAAKDTVSNIFGGFTIFADQPFKLNDRVKVAGFDGFIREIGLRSTRLQTLEGRIVTIPNSRFADAPVENVSREPSRKITLNLGLTYDTTPEGIERAMKILRDIAEQHPSVEDDIRTCFEQFGDFSLGILFIYFIREGEDILQTQTDVNLAILRRFNEQGLEFAFPTQTIHAKSEGATLVGSQHDLPIPAAAARLRPKSEPKIGQG